MLRDCASGSARMRNLIPQRIEQNQRKRSVKRNTTHRLQEVQFTLKGGIRRCTAQPIQPNFLRKFSPVPDLHENALNSNLNQRRHGKRARYAVQVLP
jgi:hypothetical protein